MNIKTKNQKISSLSASERLPLGLSVESLKRMRAMSTRFTDIGFPAGIEKEISESIISFKREDSILKGDVKISC